MLFKLSKILLYMSVFTVVIVSTATLFPFIVGKYAFFRITTELALVFFLLGLAMSPDAGIYVARLKKLFRNPLVWAVTAFVAIFLLAGFMGVRPSFSFWSNFERGEGGFQMLNLYIYFLLIAVLFRELRNWKIYFICALIAAALMALYGVGASLKYIDAEQVTVLQYGLPTKQLSGNGGPWFQTFKSFSGSWFGEPGYRFQGTIGNPAYVAAFLLFIFFDAAMLAVIFKNKRKVLIALALAVIAFAVVFYSAGTRGALLGLIAGVFVWVSYLGVAHKALRRKILPFIAAALLIVLILVIFQKTSFVQRIPGSRIFDISFSAATFSTRTIMWSIAWHAWQARPVLGFGPENFIWIFDRYFNPRYYDPAQGFGAWFDRAHSIIFDYLAETGILGLLSYLSMFAVSAWFVVRKPLAHLQDGDLQSQAVKGLLLALPAAYLVQGIVLFDVLVIYMGLFAFFAFLIFMFLTEPQAERFMPGPVTYSAAIGLTILAFLGIYYGALLPYAKASAFVAAESNVSNITTEAQFEDHFSPVLKFDSPVGSEEVPKFLSGDILSAIGSVKDSGTAHALVKFIEPYLLTDDIRHILIKAQLYGLMWQNFRNTSDYDVSLAAFSKAHEIAPKLPQPMQGMIALYQMKGDNADADKIAKEMLALWPTTRVAVSGAASGK